METPERYWSGLYWDGFVPESIGALELLHAESEEPTINAILNTCRIRMVQQNEPIQEYHVSLIDMAAADEEEEIEKEREEKIENESTESILVKEEEKLPIQPTPMSIVFPSPPLLPVASIPVLESTPISPASSVSLSNSSTSSPSSVANSNSSVISQVMNLPNPAMTGVIPSASLSPSSFASTRPSNHDRCSGRCLVLRLWHNDVFLGARETAKGDPGAKCKDWHFMNGEFAHELTLEETDQLLEQQALKTDFKQPPST